jgi:RHS repeat-associated protein
LAVTNYHTINGQIIGESTGGTLTSYLPDALGSVIATAKAGAIKNTYRTTPYGTTTVKTGADPDPRYVYNGTWGYRKTAMPYVDQYVWARHRESFSGRWATVDPIWPYEHPYSYVDAEPIDWVDPFGLQKQFPHDRDGLLSGLGAGLVGKPGFIPNPTITPGPLLGEGVQGAANTGRLIGSGGGTFTAETYGMLGATVVIGAGIYAVFDLLNYAITRKPGAFTGVGCVLAKEIAVSDLVMVDAIEADLPFRRYRHPRDCDEAKKQVHRLCSPRGGPPNCDFTWRQLYDPTLRMATCYNARYARNWAADCLLARRMQNLLCPATPGKPKPPAGADEGHAIRAREITNTLNKCRIAMRKLDCWGIYGIAYN